MKIGDVEINGKVILGPMAGVTTLAYREFMKPFGVALSYSEMISDCGLIYGNAKTEDYVATSKTDRPVGLQLFGHSKEETVKGIEILERIADYDILDINLGCPVHKVVKTGAGSAWLKSPEKLFEYMEAVCKASHKPVTAKIRLGWDEDSINFQEVVPLLEKAGVKAITIHSRTSRQMYEGKANHEALIGLKKSMNVPLIVSGDIFTYEDAIRVTELTEADAIMVARGALGNPILVTQINAALNNLEVPSSPTLKQQIIFAKDFANKLILEKGEETAIRQLRGLIPHFISGFPGHKKARNEITQNVDTAEDLFIILDRISSRGRF